MTISEQLCELQTDAGALIGVVTFSHERQDWQALIVPAPGQTRVGPERIYLRLARALADIGVSSLRFDAHDGGDAPGDGDDDWPSRHAAGSSAAQRTGEALGEVRGDDEAPDDSAILAAARELHRRHPQAPLMLIGIDEAAPAAVHALELLEEADLPVALLLLIEPAMTIEWSPARRSWWRRMFGSAPREINREPTLHIGDELLDLDTVTDDVDRQPVRWRPLAGLLHDADIELLAVVAMDSRAHRAIESLTDSEKPWRRALRKGRLLALPDTDRWLLAPVAWHALSDWLAAHLAD